MMLIFRVPQLCDFKNEQRESTTIHVATVSQTGRSGKGRCKEKKYARSALRRVSVDSNCGK